MKQPTSACFTANAVRSLFSISVIWAGVAAPTKGVAADIVYFEASEGYLAGQYQAYEANAPSTQYGRSFSRSSPSIGIGIRLTPWIAVEEEYDDDGSYTFDNVYAYPAGPVTEFEHNQIDERLRSATTRVAITVALPKRWSLILAPGVEYQFLRQNVDYLQWYTVPFSLAQVVPNPSTQTYKFWRPDFDARLSHTLAAHLSVFVGYRFFESPGKELSRISGGVSALW
jgi:hypothetical protein